MPLIPPFLSLLKRGVSILVPQIRVCPVLQENLGNIGPAKAGSIVKRGGLEATIDLCTVLEEVLNLGGRGNRQEGRD